MLYKVSGVILALLLVGCAMEPTGMDVAKGLLLCKEHKGVYSLATPITQVKVVCRDGTRKTFPWPEWREISDPLIAEYIEKLEEEK